ncbi:MAG TPA: lipopolysaccharide heptosyltransferase II, partial [Smithellaceae bacterium]|nr:lipopolysaccharide heptosyltransferase II [Smithellaceae bacterium]
IITGIAPGATYGPAKRWFPQRFAAVADLLADCCGCAVVIMGGKSDDAAAEEVQRQAKNALTNLAGKTTLAEAVHIISQCSLFISNDSGLMHIAGALNIPTIAIFGSTNPVTTKPAGSQSVIIRKEVSCSPCLQETCAGDFRCMDLITVEDVVGAARQFLTGKRVAP